VPPTDTIPQVWPGFKGTPMKPANCSGVTATGQPGDSAAWATMSGVMRRSAELTERWYQGAGYEVGPPAPALSLPGSQVLEFHTTSLTRSLSAPRTRRDPPTAVTHGDPEG
jgi:hypothetical protein